jgi:lysophospholipase L1-like esterase
MNLGISGDGTQHVLWRLDNGNVDGTKPKLAVLMIGTDNSNRYEVSAEDLATAIKAVVKKLSEKLPETKVLVLAIFPRTDDYAVKANVREKSAKASQIVSEAADNKMIFFLDIGPKFLEPDGTLSREVMPDLVHLGPKGYQIWAESIEDKVAELMGK